MKFPVIAYNVFHLSGNTMSNIRIRCVLLFNKYKLHGSLLVLYSENFNTHLNPNIDDNKMLSKIDKLLNTIQRATVQVRY